MIPDGTVIWTAPSRLVSVAPLYLRDVCRAYTRVCQDSTGERLAIARQLDDCTLLAERLGWTVVDHFSDNDISAFDGSTRPEFERMLDAIKRGEINAIICWQPDRLYRSMKDLERLVEATDRGIEIRSVNGGDLDLSNSTGRMLARILGSVSRQESELKGERRRRANKQRALTASGAKTVPRAFGYTQTGEPLEPEATAVRQAINDVLGGRSLRSVATDWNQRGMLTARGKQWSNLTLRRALARPATPGWWSTRATWSAAVNGSPSSTKTPTVVSWRSCPIRRGDRRPVRAQAHGIRCVSLRCV